MWSRGLLLYELVLTKRGTSMPIDLKVAKWAGYIAIILGILRLVDYYFYGNAHHLYALAWALHALITGLLMIWLSKWISNKENRT